MTKAALRIVSFAFVLTNFMGELPNQVQHFIKENFIRASIA